MNNDVMDKIKLSFAKEESPASNKGVAFNVEVKIAKNIKDYKKIIISLDNK